MITLHQTVYVRLEEIMNPCRARIFENDQLLLEATAEGLAEKAPKNVDGAKVKDGIEKKYSFLYSGKHDHGDMPDRKNKGGDLDRARSFLLNFKEEALKVLSKPESKLEAKHLDKKQKHNNQFTSSS